MKRLLFILAFFVLASVGVQAQVVGEEPYEILWEMELDSTNYFNSRSFCISADSTSYYYQGGIYNYQSIIYKRNIETNEIEAEYEIPKSDSCLWYMQASDKYLSCYALFRHAIVLRDPNTFEFIKELKIDINQLINNFDSKYKDLYFDQFQLTNNSKYAIVMYRFWDNDNDEYFILVAYDINNDTYKMFYSNFYLKNDNYYDYKIEKLQLSNDGNKLYAVRYYGYSPGDLDFGFYEWDISNDFEVKELYLNLTSHEVTENYNYKISPDNSKLLLFANTNLNYFYYDLFTNEIIKTHYSFYILQNYFCFSQFNSKLLLSIIIDSDYYNILYDIIVDKYFVIDSTEKLTKGFQNPLFYGLENSTMISFNNDASKKPKKLIALKFNYDTIMGAKEEEGKIELLYPNPATETINIPINEYTERIEVYDVSGDLVFESLSIKTTQRVASTLSMDISRLPVGTYFVKVYQTESIIDYKFIKG